MKLKWRKGTQLDWRRNWLKMLRNREWESVSVHNETGVPWSSGLPPTVRRTVPTGVQTVTIVLRPRKNR